MAKDFRASQVLTSKIIGSGSLLPSSSLGLAIYSGSEATSRTGGIPTEMLNRVGTDVWLFVSGAQNPDLGAARVQHKGVTLFGGDVVVSGTLYAERQVIEVDSIADGDFFVTGNLKTKPDANGIRSVEFNNASDIPFFVVDTQNGYVAINDAANNGVDFRVETGGEDEAFFVDASANVIYINKGETTVSTHIASVNDIAITVAAPGVIFNEDGHASNDFRVESNTKQNAIFVDAGADQVLILSGGSNKSFNEALGSDVAFYVSGSVGSRGVIDSTGSAVFGGDTLISGSLGTQGNASIEGTLYVASDIQHLGDTNTLIRFTDDNIAITAGGVNFIKAAESTQNTLVINEDGATNSVDIDFRVETTGEDEALFVDAGANMLYINKGETVFGTVIGNVNDEAFRVASVGVILNEDGHADNDLRVESDNRSHALFVNAGTDQIFILSGSGVTGGDGTDVALYVSGSVSSKGSVNKGVSLFGGDAVFSGSVYGLQGLSGSITNLTDGKSYIAGGAGIAVTSASNGQIVITNDGGDITSVAAGTGLTGGGNAGDVTVNAAAGTGIVVNSNDIAIHDSVVATLSGSIFSGRVTHLGDVFLSGSVSDFTATGSAKFNSGLSGSLTRLTNGKSYLVGGSNVTVASASNGQVTVSVATTGEWVDGGSFLRPADSSGVESIVIGGDSLAAADILLSSDGGAIFNEQGASVDFRVESNTKTNAILVSGSTDQVLILSGGDPSSANESTGTDLAFFVSGAIGSRGTALKGTSLFGGDLVTSGTMYMSDTLKSAHNQNSYLQFEYPGGGVGSFKLVGGGDPILTRDVSGTPTSIVINSDGAGISTLIKTNAKYAIASKHTTNTVYINSDNAGEDGADTSFYVSGSIGSMDTATRGTSTFGGDLVVSGGFKVDASTLVVDESNSRVGVGTDSPSYNLDVADSSAPAARFLNNANNAFGGLIRLENNRGGSGAGQADDFCGGATFNAPNSAASATQFAKISSKIVSPAAGGEIGSITFETATGLANKGNPLFMRADRVLVLSGGAAASTNEAGGEDVAFYVSGSIGSKGTSDRGASLFGGDVVVSGTIMSKTRHFTHHAFNTSTTNRVFIPFAGTSDSTSATIRYQNTWVTPAAGRLVRFFMRPFNNMQNEQVTGSIHIVGDGANNANVTAIEEVRLTVSATANATTIFDFTGSNHFIAGDWCAISVHAPDAVGVGANGCNITCVWELDEDLKL